MIATQLLGDVAGYVDGRIEKVVINGTYEITDFVVKQVSGSTVALQYIVPVADVTNIDLIELKDAADNLLTSDSVDVPLTADTLLLQTILVKEVTT